MNRAFDGGLERSCRARPGAVRPGGGDWVRQTADGDGLLRLEAFFAGHAYDPHRHDTYAIGLTDGGVQCFTYRGAHRTSAPGTLMVLHPDERHDGEAGAAAGFRYRMIYVPPHRIAVALAGRARALPFARAALTRDRRLRRAVAPALADMARPLEELEADQVTQEVAEALLSLDPSAATGRTRGASCPASVERARQILDAHCDRVVTSAELEAATGLDRYTLARQFRAMLGTSPYRYLTLRRLDRARTALLGGESLAGAACAAGFADQSHMTRHFTRTVGISPGRWLALTNATRHDPSLDDPSLDDPVVATPSPHQRVPEHGPQTENQEQRRQGQPLAHQIGDG
ncbi:AraC family transcriptional regulator [Roseospira visakhapatnamensis]|uniref:AraC-like DNA-binding protein n=1 Tax=Roseospira visakhapatnamensis TaxID=390880 RepID=A0A7W6W9N1_9PROT|nr:AraC family transcriptional regulator [Roseospira visakhapatnamensis]MBB4265968.1 AraC-like DNA-binding protein [Roseospira visakhapatnamensis]